MGHVARLPLKRIGSTAVWLMLINSGAVILFGWINVKRVMKNIVKRPYDLEEEMFRGQSARPRKQSEEMSGRLEKKKVNYVASTCLLLHVNFNYIRLLLPNFS
jgi:hypothetical protein